MRLWLHHEGTGLICVNLLMGSSLNELEREGGCNELEEVGHWRWPEETSLLSLPYILAGVRNLRMMGKSTETSSSVANSSLLLDLVRLRAGRSPCICS